MKRGRRLHAVAAGDVRPGDVLWSDASGRELRVIAVHRELVRADGNLYADPEEPGVELAEAVVVTVVDELTGKETQRLGAFAPRARLQVVGYVPHESSVAARR